MQDGTEKVLPGMGKEKGQNLCEASCRLDATNRPYLRDREIPGREEKNCKLLMYAKKGEREGLRAVVRR